MTENPSTPTTLARKIQIGIKKAGNYIASEAKPAIEAVKNFSKEALVASGRVLKNTANKTLETYVKVIDADAKSGGALLQAAGLWGATAVFTGMTAAGLIAPNVELGRICATSFGVATAATGTAASYLTEMASQKLNPQKVNK